MNTFMLTACTFSWRDTQPLIAPAALAVGDRVFGFLSCRDGKDDSFFGADILDAAQSQYAKTKLRLIQNPDGSQRAILFVGGKPRDISACLTSLTMKRHYIDSQTDVISGKASFDGSCGAEPVRGSVEFNDCF